MILVIYLPQFRKSNAVRLAVAAFVFFAALPVIAQTNLLAPASNHVATAQQIEKVRQECIDNRRMIAGKILQIQPDGLVIDSGYTNLDRYPLNRSWLAPGTVVANRATNVLEDKRPDSICMGLVFIADLPPTSGHTPKLYAYVHLEGFPMGEYTYHSVGDVRRTVRKFSAKLPKAMEWRMNSEKK